MTGQGADGGAESCAASSKGRKYEYHRSYLGTLLFFLVAIYMTVIMFLSWVGVSVPLLWEDGFAPRANRMASVHQAQRAYC